MLNGVKCPYPLQNRSTRIGFVNGVGGMSAFDHPGKGAIILADAIGKAVKV
jgi:hypothetical protein